MNKYPECEKLAKVSDKSQLIGEFLEWLQYDKEITLAFLEPKGIDYIPYPFSVEKLLADFFEIDLKKVEKERRQILQEMRNK